VARKAHASAGATQADAVRTAGGSEIAGRRAALVAVLLLVIAVSYVPSLRNEFVWDDVLHIVQNPRIERWSEIPRFFAEPEGLYYRPLIFLSYAVEHAVWGLTPPAFHFTNLLLHLLNTVLLVVLLRRFDLSLSAALSAAALFGLHPMQTEAVAYISGRTDLLVACSALLAWLVLWGEGRAIWRGLASGFLAAIAIGSKESGYAVVLIVAWAAWRGGRDRREHLILSMPTLLTALLLLFLRPGGFPDLGTVEPIRLVAGAGNAIGSYVSVLFWPAALRVDRLTGMSVGGMAIAAGTLLFMTAGLVFVWGVTRRGRTADWTAWVGAFYLPVANLIVLYPAIADWALFTPEHNLYVPLIGLSALAGIALDRLAISTSSSLRRAAGTLLCAVLSVLAILTWNRCRDWHDEQTLFASAARAGSRSPRVWYNLGNSRLQRKMPAEAAAAFEQALVYAPRDPEIWMNLGVARQQQRDLDGALEAYQKAAVLAPRDPAVFENLGTLFWARRDLPAARRSFERALQLDPQRDVARRALVAIDQIKTVSDEKP
jgi:Tfp pilus assembly protein PilF